MGITYSAAMVNRAEAWEIGKDYYGLVELFPPCAQDFFGRAIVGNAVFCVSDLYPDADAMIEQLVANQKRLGIMISCEDHLRGFYDWAADEPIQFIGDFDDLEDREAEVEYQLCAKPTRYVYVNQYNGKAGRLVGTY